ncbi:MAG: sortase [Candidatus Paceibacterota bacterium]|jgi:LPXTG-site transpeptidase (sortase) family protein
MKEIVEFTARLVLAGKQAYTRKWSFLGAFVLVFFVSVAILSKLDLLPEASPVSAEATTVVTESPRESEPILTIELPTKIEIPTLGLSVRIANPTTTDIETLDKELLAGAVRYPTSAKLGETGNVVLFGHSSYLPVVNNQAYKTFNGIQKLVAGDLVTVSSSGTAYTYRVRSVVKESAASNAGIDLAVASRVLTVSTCNSFGQKSDRFVVTADFVESHAISG